MLNAAIFMAAAKETQGRHQNSQCVSPNVPQHVSYSCIKQANYLRLFPLNTIYSDVLASAASGECNRPNTQC